ncbi:lytic transglycosylase domain-containing protein [Halodurantibacterium flavum]|uniref:Lytic transglycosylase domain-containing protein n=1 Tax=Halodurantibacterium flavum TaxID=1382802 RepID=A0ABW4S9Y0_9RHOB
MKRIVLTALFLCWGLPGLARADLSVLCDRAAIEASEATGVPLSVMKAITRAETGRPRQGEMRPWPWTVNMEGRGAWFDTMAEALTFVRDHHRRGARSFDVGCFQINYHWHGENFSSFEEMFDPRSNAFYAARFLRDLYHEQGSWDMAAGAYHSRTPEFAQRYRARFEAFRARFLAEDGMRHSLPDLPAGAVTRAVRVRVNTYPLLLPGSGGRGGSLVSTDAQAAGPFFSSAARPLVETGDLP